MAEKEELEREEKEENELRKRYELEKIKGVLLIILHPHHPFLLGDVRNPPQFPRLPIIPFPLRAASALRPGIRARINKIRPKEHVKAKA